MPIRITLPDVALDLAPADPAPAADASPADAAPADLDPLDGPLDDPLDAPLDLALSDQQRRFVLEYVIDLNGTAAVARAGYTRGCAAQWAAHALRRPAIQAAIRRELKAREGRTRVTGDRIVAEVARIAFADPSRIARWSPGGVRLRHSDDLTADDLAAVKRISIGESKGKGNRRAQHIEMHDKIGALALLARLTGMLTRGSGGGFGVPEAGANQGPRADARAVLRERLMRIIRGAATATPARATTDAKAEEDDAVAAEDSASDD